MVYVVASTVTADGLSCYTNCKYRLVPPGSRYSVRPLAFGREFSAFMPQLKPKLEDHFPSFRILLSIQVSVELCFSASPFDNWFVSSRLD